jgi:hypothetical protein
MSCAIAQQLVQERPPRIFELLYQNQDGQPIQHGRNHPYQQNQVECRQYGVGIQV